MGFYRMKHAFGPNEAVYNRDISVFYAEDPKEFDKRASKKNRENPRVGRLIEEIYKKGSAEERRIREFFMDKPSDARDILNGKKRWVNGSSRVEEMMDSVSGASAQYTFVRKFTRSEEGFDLDVDKFRDYDFERMWISMKSTAKTKRGTTKVISFVQNCCDNFTIKPESFIWNGIALTALADTLESAGIRTWITAAWGINNLLVKKPRMHTNRFVNFLDRTLPDQPLDINHLVSWTAHPGALRVQVFKTWLNQPYIVNGGLGQPMRDKQIEMISKEVLDRDFIMVPRMYDKHQAIKFLNETLTDLGLSEKEEE